MPSDRRRLFAFAHFRTNSIACTRNVAMNKAMHELTGPRATDAWSGIIHPPMTDIPFTTEQRQAIEATGRSVIVSAAAGSGKTAVLAERCAYLVCDAPQGDRCDVDELLVLTFTESAASEMRSRIVQAIRGRMEKRPADLRLREQATLVDAARISTIHAFCNWLVRRWFNEAGIDPSASLLGADEEPLLKREVLTGLFRALYGQVSAPGSSPGR